MTVSADPSALTARGAERRSVMCLAAWVAFAGAGLAGRVGADEQLPASSALAVLRALGGSPTPSSQVRITVPQLIENGSVVPITVDTDMRQVSDIYVLADMNPSPVAAHFRLDADLEPRISLRIKLAESGRVYGAVRTNSGLFWAAAAAEVTAGGCA